MKHAIAGFLALTMTLTSVQGFALQEESQTIIALKNQLSAQKAELSQLKEQLKSSQNGRKGWIALTVTAGAASAIMALPGVMSTYSGVKNLSQGRPYFGDPDNGGTMMIPVILATAVVSVATGQVAYAGYQMIEIRSADIKTLLDKIQAKQVEIDQAEKLLNSMQERPF